MAVTTTEIATFFTQAVFPTLWQLIQTPLQQKEILWTILPLLISAFFVELYFGRYKTEALGWNTAFANCISLLWVTAALLRFLYEHHGWQAFTTWNMQTTTPSLIILGILMSWSLLFAITTYFHTFPKQVAFLFTSTIPINMVALIITLIIMGGFPITHVTFIAAVLSFIILTTLFAIVHALVRPSPEARRYIEAYKKKAAQKKEEREKHFFKEVHQITERLITQYKATLATIKGFFKRA